MEAMTPDNIVSSYRRACFRAGLAGDARQVKRSVMKSMPAPDEQNCAVKKNATALNEVTSDIVFSS